MTPSFSVPTTAGEQAFSVRPGNSINFVGANGGGKTRLAVHIEDSLGLKAHRISAHRALKLNPDVAKIGEKKALMGLRTGHAAETSHAGHRLGSRWGASAAVFLLSDYDFLLQALFAEQANTSLRVYNLNKPGVPATSEEFKFTKFDQLVKLWEKLLPHRSLHVTGDEIQVSIPGRTGTYSASDMSDGERAIFYMIGQVLVADDQQVLIIDEPELHVHRSIMSKLWDELEGARPDCSFIFITHDLEFAAAREAEKYVIRDYSPDRGWTISEVPDDSGFDEELITLILGSRRPILFVEGDQGSLDSALYRCCYPGWTVVPRGSCAEVIHSVVTMRANSRIAWVKCAGIVDGDGHDESDRSYLASLGVAVLPVSEIENLILLPEVSRAIGMMENFAGEELESRLDQLAARIFSMVESEEVIERTVVRHCTRRIDRLLKKVDLSASRSVEELQSGFRDASDSVDVVDMANRARQELKDAVSRKDLRALLKIYDNKGLLSAAASILKGCRLEEFKGWLTRSLRSGAKSPLSEVLAKYTPEIESG